MRYCEIINEARQAPLYHGTSFFGAVAIITDNEIADISKQFNILGDGRAIKGVSLTRSVIVARIFGPVVFVLDQMKLSHNIKIVPTDYWQCYGNSPEHSRSNGGKTEAEEFAIGPIKNLSRYLIRIVVDERSLERFQDGRPDWQDYMKTLLDHPKLIVSIGAELGESNSFSQIGNLEHNQYTNPAPIEILAPAPRLERG